MNDVTRDDAWTHMRDQAALILDTDLDPGELRDASERLASAFRDIDTGTVHGAAAGSLSGALSAFDQAAIEGTTAEEIAAARALARAVRRYTEMAKATPATGPDMTNKEFTALNRQLYAAGHPVAISDLPPPGLADLPPGEQLSWLFSQNYDIAQVIGSGMIIWFRTEAGLTPAAIVPASLMARFRLASP